MEYNHSCIKCKTKYDSDDPDAYLCEECNKTRRQIAEEVDKKMANRPRKKVESWLTKYDAITKKTGARFPSAKDMGI